MSDEDLDVEMMRTGRVSLAFGARVADLRGAMETLGRTRGWAFAVFLMACSRAGELWRESTGRPRLIDIPPWGDAVLFAVCIGLTLLWARMAHTRARAANTELFRWMAKRGKDEP